ncbi:Tat pathway signal sequence domain protein [Sphingomonas parva]|uniref:Tat pathway signal sequence domain protein n=1 Tax=Sphingomonas parva TaxID=2555898 RepID=A0A4Y8ZQ98_9SPHN|nr:DUF6250 domain-containing protein [Sphingomonas parva]TFI57647.1 Tat pathway signal sequence domain protein [Sphingomonas parva]
MWDIASVDRRAFLAALAGGAALAGCAPVRGRSTLLYHDDFRSGLDKWLVEAEKGGRFSAEDGVLDIDSPGGVTLWFRPRLESPVAIDYEVTAVAEGGTNDQVSDINCFWMATDARAPGGDVLARPRSGAFADYDELRTYYAGIGGNRNTTTRFRRYIGRRDDRPLLPQHDLSAAADLIVPNRPYRIRLVAAGSRIALIRDGRTLFRLDDPEPYTRGHFGLRTTWSHLRIRDFRVRRLPA